jgi:hypothetical protein
MMIDPLLCPGHQIPGGYSAGLLDVSAAAGERGGRVGNEKPTQKSPKKPPKNPLKMFFFWVFLNF